VSSSGMKDALCAPAISAAPPFLDRAVEPVLCTHRKAIPDWPRDGPTAQRLVDPEDSRLASQEEECRLEGIVGGPFGVIEHAPANGPGPSGLCRCTKALNGQLIALRDISVQDLGVGQARQGPLTEEQVNLPHRRAPDVHLGPCRLPSNSSRGPLPILGADDASPVRLFREFLRIRSIRRRRLLVPEFPAQFGHTK